MKKNKLLVISCLSAVLLSAASSQALTQKSTGSYISVPFGYSFVNNPKSSAFSSGKLKNTPLVGLAAGYDFGGLRTELSFTYRNNLKFTNNYQVTSTVYNYAFNPMSVKSYSFMLDVYKDFDIGSEFTPFINAGLGVTRFKTGDYTSYRITNSTGFVRAETYPTAGAKTSNSFAWRVGAGMNYQLTQSVDFGLAYSFTYLGKVSRLNPHDDGTGQVTNKIKFRANEIIASLKFKL